VRITTCTTTQTVGGMENHPDYIEAVRVKRHNEAQLAEVNNKIASVEMVWLSAIVGECDSG
jgi:hypothetical protein